MKLRNMFVYNAYSIKDDLKKMGFKWGPNEKAWYTHVGNITLAMEKQLHKLGVWW